MPFQPLPLETDPTAAAQRILTGLSTAFAALGLTYRPSEGALDTALAQEIGRELASTNARTITAAAAAVAGFGQTLVGLAAIIGVQASLPVTFTVAAAGTVIPAGFQVTAPNPAGLPVVFTLPAAVTAATTSQTATLTALDVGSAYNGVAAGALRTVTATSTVLTVTATAPSSGGVDAETLDAYTARLSDFMSVYGAKVVRAADVVQVARRVTGVQRALALDLYDATTGASGTAAEKTVSVYPVDASGAALSSAVKATLAAALAAVREVNFIYRIADPTYTQVTVAFTATARPGYDPAVVQAAAVASLVQYLSPAAWGASNPAAPTDWTAKGVVKRDDLVGRLYATVAGLGALGSLTVNGGTADVTLAGVAALPASTTAASSPSSVTGTVSAAS